MTLPGFVKTPNISSPDVLKQLCKIVCVCMYSAVTVGWILTVCFCVLADLTSEVFLLPVFSVTNSQWIALTAHMESVCRNSFSSLSSAFYLTQHRMTSYYQLKIKLFFNSSRPHNPGHEKQVSKMNGWNWTRPVFATIHVFPLTFYAFIPTLYFAFHLKAPLGF